MKKITDMTKELIKGLPTVESLTIQEYYNPETTAVAYIRGKNNLHSYKFKWEHRLKVASLLAVGGTVIVILPHSNLPGIVVRHKDQETVDHFQIKQLLYLFNKYSKINSEFYQGLGKELFAGWTRGELRKFTKDVLPILNADRPWASDVLDYEYKDALERYEDVRATQIEHWAEAQRLTALWNEAANELRIFKSQEEELKNLPNQDVTRNGDGVVAEAEQLIINAWMYKTPGFRVPTLDEQIAELHKLREWFEQYKHQARRNNVRNPQARTLEKFERLEFLEIEVGPYLEGDRALSVLGNPPKVERHESNTFKLERLAQLARREQELNDPRLTAELRELKKELSK